MTKDSKDMERSCFVIAAIVAVLLAARARGIVSRRDNSRTPVPGSDGAVAVDAGTSAAPPPKTETPR